jgi:Ca-activated chloride channel homolog
MNDMKLILTPRRAAVLAGTRSTVDVLARLQAPTRPEGAARTRGALHLALVIDRSGSMSGQPLAEAKRCARFVVDGLAPGDKAAVIAYDSDVQRLTPLLGMEDRETLRRAIDGIHEGGTTNLHGGWLAGAETLAPHTDARTLSRVILLSDGNANVGLSDSGAICPQVRELAEAGVTTSTYGLGVHFNEELMTAMADAGRGNAYYGQTAEDLADPFREELALLEALCARQVELSLEPATGVSVEVLNGYARLPNGRWRLPDVAYEGEAWALLRLTVEAGVAAAGATVTLVRARADWHGLDGSAAGIAPVELALPAMPAAAYGAVAEDPLVRRRAEELEVAGLQEVARTAARRRDWATVDRTLVCARTMARENPWLQGVTDELEGLARQRDEERFAKEAMYSARRVRSRLASQSESAVPDADSVPDYLRRKFAQGKDDRSGHKR